MKTLFIKQPELPRSVDRDNIHLFAKTEKVFLEQLPPFVTPFDLLAEDTSDCWVGLSPIQPIAVPELVMPLQGNVLISDNTARPEDHIFIYDTVNQVVATPKLIARKKPLFFVSRYKVVANFS